MNESTPSQRKEKIFPNINELKLNSLSSPIEANNHFDKLLNSKYNENLTKKSKTIAHSKQNNNISSMKESAPKPNNLFINNFDLLNKTKTDQDNNKDRIDYKTRSLPKNRNNEINEKNENMFSKSSNNVPKINKKNRASNNNFKASENFADNEISEGDDSENLSKLAEDLLSISDEYNNAQLMRMAPIDKKDFIGESKEIFNINNKKNQIKRFSDFNQIKYDIEKNMKIEQSSQKSEKNDKVKNIDILDKNEINKEPNLTKIHSNVINMENLNNINQMPKLQTQLYISPIQKYHAKNQHNNYNNLDYNLNNDSTNYNSNNNISKLTRTEGRKFTKIKNHISSNSIVNNNISKPITNYQTLNFTDLSSQIKNINYYNNNNNFNKTKLNQYNNIWDINREIDQYTINLNNSNINANPNRSSNKNINNYNLYNDNYIKNNQRNNRNNNSIGKKENLLNQNINTIKNNISNYSGYNHKTNINYNKNNTTNNAFNSIHNINSSNNFNNNLNNINTFSHLNIIKKNDINFYISNEINNIKNQNLQKRKIDLESCQYNRMINNNRYNTKKLQNIESINKNLNNINFNMNKDYSYGAINKNITNNLAKNKSVNKNEHSNRKNLNMIQQKNFLRTSDFRRLEMNSFQTFNEEERKAITQMNNSKKNLIQRNSLQNKSQSKKVDNEIKDIINSPNHTPANKGLNYINMKNINNNTNNIGNLNIIKNFHVSNLNNANNPNLNLNNFQNRIRNKTFYGY